MRRTLACARRLDPADGPQRSRQLCVWVMLALTALGATASNAQPRPHLVQSVDLQVPVAPIPVTIAGKRHLAYELRVTNFRPVEVALTRIEVLDAGRKTTLADLRDAQLANSLGRPGAPATLADKRVIGAGMQVVVYFWLSLDDGMATPARLQHRVGMDLLRPAGTEHVVIDGAALEVSQQKPAVLGAPLRGGPWVALYDPRMIGGHRTSIYTLEGRARIPARYAIDWVKLENDATHAKGDDTSIANWHGYGAEVLAVANATVADAADDMSEAPSRGETSEPLPLENHSGNYVTLDLGNGRYAFYEHLKHGSIKVKSGDRVKRGQVIGLLGNSGSSSSGPHLHFHIADASAELAAEGVPFVFEEFEVIGEFEAIDVFTRNERWRAPQNGAGGRRRMELPLANSVVVFR